MILDMRALDLFWVNKKNIVLIDEIENFFRSVTQEKLNSVIYLFCRIESLLAWAQIIFCTSSRAETLNFHCHRRDVRASSKSNGQRSGLLSPTGCFPSASGGGRCVRRICPPPDIGLGMREWGYPPGRPPGSGWRRGVRYLWYRRDNCSFTDFWSISELLAIFPSSRKPRFPTFPRLTMEGDAGGEGGGYRGRFYSSACQTGEMSTLQFFWR